ncbi:MAG: hypothetical protein HZA22_04740 [Nitrospirae bacterium]|nr:hypothetical protein [Nitrospirota bacterium]
MDGLVVINKQEILSNNGEWVTWQGKARVKLRPVPNDEGTRINERHTKTGWKKHQPIKEVDERKADEDRWDYQIPDWEGLVDAEGKPLPCTRENKVFLMRHYVPFAYFVNTVIFEMANGEKVVAEEEAKNSNGSPDGSDGPGE